MGNPGNPDNQIQQQEFTVAQPAAGADWAYAVPAAGQAWQKLISFFLSLASSAIVASRFLRIQITDASGNTRWMGGATAAVTASQNVRFGAAVGSPQQAPGGTSPPSLLYLPDIWLPPGYSIGASSLGLDAGDQYSIVRGILLSSNGNPW